MKTSGKSKPSLLTIPYVARDIEILYFLFCTRYATTTQIWKKFFPHTSRLVTNQRLKKLVDYGLLRVIPRATVRGTGSLPNLYALAPLGASLLSYEKSIPLKHINTTPFSDEAWNLQIKHTLKTTDVLLALDQACELSGFSLSWETDREIRAQIIKETSRFAGPDGQQYRTPIPDLLLTLKREGKSARCWVEVDRASENIGLGPYERQSLSGKMLEYLAWEGSEHYLAEHGTRPLRTLFLTIGSLRMHNMVAAAEKVIRQNLAQQTNLSGDKKQAEFVRLSKRFRLLTFDSMQPETLLTGPVWTVAGRDTLQTMFE